MKDLKLLFNFSYYSVKQLTKSSEITFTPSMPAAKSAPQRWTPSKPVEIKPLGLCSNNCDYNLRLVSLNSKINFKTKSPSIQVRKFVK